MMRCRPGTPVSWQVTGVPDQRCTTRASALALHRIRDTRVSLAPMRASGHPYVDGPRLARDGAASGSDRLRSYVRSIDGGAHDRLPRWVPRRESQTVKRHRVPLDATEYVASWDRSITPSAPS